MLFKFEALNMMTSIDAMPRYALLIIIFIYAL